ncbi:MAG: beta-galactosidase [Phycisphaerales bacterium]
MPSANFDSRTLSIDAKRIWIVSGSMHFQRIPSELWDDRIRAAKAAGVNTIETPIFWNLIEPRPGSYDFTGNNDIKHFLTLLAKHNMYAILRPGPFIGAGWDLGGLPAWLLNIADVKLRSPNQPFLEAVGRYFNALAKQIKTMQASTTVGGPIIMIQNESQWDCDDQLAATKYLGELARYLREAGFTVPKINANNLWQGVEGEIDGWTGEGDMFAIMRQLKAVRPEQPTVVIDYGPLRRPIFGQHLEESVDGYTLQRQLGEIMSAGGQFNIANFMSGTSFGFWAGQSSVGEPCSYAPTYDAGALIDEHGRMTKAMGPVRRLLTFGSSFSRVLAHTENAAPPVVIDPVVDEDAIQGHIVNQMNGSQGNIIFIFSPPRARAGTINLLLSDGSSLPVRLGTQRVHWCLTDVNLSPKHTLDYTSLCALSSTEDTLVLFGPGGAIGEVSINSSPLVVEVPKGRKPFSIMHEGICVVVVSEDVVDETHMLGSDVFVGVHGLSVEGEPMPSPNGKTHTHVTPDGKSKTTTTKHLDREAPEKLPKIALGNWECAQTDEHVDGSSPRYAVIPGPADLSELGTPYGYGWYKIDLKSAPNGKVKVAAPQSADRVQFFLDGESVGIIGSGPAAQKTIPMNLKSDSKSLVALADNTGRISGGSVMDENKGLFGHIIEDTPYKIGKHSIITGEPIDVLEYVTPVFGVRQGETTHHKRIQWSFKHLKKSSIHIEIPPINARVIVVLNDEPIKLVGAMRRTRIELDNETTKRGNNVLEFALHLDAPSHELADELADQILETMTKDVTFTEGANVISEKCEWSFAKWEAPSEIDFDTVTKSKLGSVSGPCWWKTSFKAPRMDLAISLDTTGLTKGQAYINGNALGRFFSSTSDGKAIEPHQELAIPSSWINEDADNELLIFDEHGASPAKIKLIVERL